MQLLRTSASLAILLMAWPAAADAAPIWSISIGDLSIGPNGTGTVAVMVTGTGEGANLAGYEFRIVPNAGTTSQLQFLEETEAFLGEAIYLFAGNSAAASDAFPSSVGAVVTTLLPNDTFVGGDGAEDLGDTVVTGSKLLVRLAVQHSSGPADPATTVGHAFSIALAPENGDSSEFAAGNSNTGFMDSAFAGIGFASQPATVTVVVPETSTLGLSGIAFLLAFRRRFATP